MPPLFERFEAKLDKHQGNLMRSAVELAKDWRTDRALRRLEAMLAVADKERSLIITGMGDVLEPSTASSRSARAGLTRKRRRARWSRTRICLREIVDKALAIAGDICIYTNQQRSIEALE